MEKAYCLLAKQMLIATGNFHGGGESRGGFRSDLDIRQPPLGVLWLLSVATESNRIASAEATEAAKKVKSAIEVTQDTS